jgi:hypothetical protein
MFEYGALLDSLVAFLLVVAKPQNASRNASAALGKKELKKLKKIIL